jgi:multidrug efflux system outer membrane protein
MGPHRFRSSRSRSGPAAAAGALLAAALVGCVVGPDYRRPEVQAPATYLYPAGQDAALADTEWWKAFCDPVLDGLITEALANNRNIKIAAANVEQAAGVLQSTRSAFYPQVGYQLNGGRNRFTNDGLTAQAAGISNPTNYYQALVGASWEIDLWGRVQRLSESAQANVLATEEARRGVILTLVANVANAYLQLRGLDEQLAMAQRMRDAYAESLRLMQAKFQYGRVSQMNVDQATARLQTAEAQIPRIQRDIALLQDALAILLARNPGAIPRGKSIFDITLPAVPAGVPSQLLERRPDLAQAEQQLIAANAQIGAAKAQYFPTISLTAALGSSSTDLSNLFKSATRNWNYAGLIAGPIFTGGAIAGQVAQAEAAQRAALQSYQLAIQSAFADVDSALASRSTLIDQQAAQEKLVKALRSYSRIAQLQFDIGRVPYSTVLQAEQELFPAELDWAADRAQLASSIVGIYKAMGGGWVAAADNLTGAGAPGKQPQGHE